MAAVANQGSAAAQAADTPAERDKWAVVECAPAA